MDRVTMTIARAQLVDPDVSCVRRDFLLREGVSDRKQWIKERLQERVDLFSIAFGGFTVLDNHLHVLVQLDPDRPSAWSDEEVVRRWGRLFPPRDQARQPIEASRRPIKNDLRLLPHAALNNAQ